MRQSCRVCCCIVRIKQDSTALRWHQSWSAVKYTIYGFFFCDIIGCLWVIVLLKPPLIRISTVMFDYQRVSKEVSKRINNRNYRDQNMSIGRWPKSPGGTPVIWRNLHAGLRKETMEFGPKFGTPNFQRHMILAIQNAVDLAFKHGFLQNPPVVTFPMKTADAIRICTGKNLLGRKTPYKNTIKWWIFPCSSHVWWRPRHSSASRPCSDLPQAHQQRDGAVWVIRSG